MTGAIWNSQKRGGGVVHCSLDAADEEARYRMEPVDHASPDVLFDRQWAQLVLQRATERLRAEYVEANFADRFELLKDFLLPGKQGFSYAEAATELRLSEAALKSAIFKIRQRFAAALLLRLWT